MKMCMNKERVRYLLSESIFVFITRSIVFEIFKDINFSLLTSDFGADFELKCATLF